MPHIELAQQTLIDLLELNLPFDTFERILGSYTSPPQAVEIQRARRNFEQIFGQSRFIGLINKLLVPYPDWLGELNEPCRVLQQHRKMLPRKISNGIAEHGMAWASEVLRSDPAIIFDTLGTEVGKESWGQAVDLHFHLIGSNKGIKRQARQYAKLGPRFDGAASRVASRLRLLPSGSIDDDTLFTVACEEAFGDLRPLLIVALTYLATYLIIRALMIYCGAPKEMVQGQLNLAHCSASRQLLRSLQLRSEWLAELLGEGIRACMFDNMEISILLTHAFELHQIHLQTLLSGAESSRQQLKAERQRSNALEKELRDEIRALKKQRTPSAPQSDAATITALNAQINKLKDEIARKDSVIHRLSRPDSTPSAPSTADNEAPLVAHIPDQPLPAAPHLSGKQAQALLCQVNAVLVGGHKNFHKHLAPHVPHWLLFGKDTPPITGDQVARADAVVFFTDHASHRLTEPVLDMARQYDKHVLYASCVNPHRFVVEIAQQVLERGLADAPTPAAG